ncbi:MAG: hypothetical protein ACK4NZ_14575, partial [Tsuneonella sp.]
MARKTAKASIRSKEIPEASGGISDSGGKAIARMAGEPADVPGPSFNPATNLIIQDIAMRAGGRLIRHTFEKGMLRGRYGGAGAKAIVENRSLVQTLVTSVMARYATRSLPGALLVGSGLVAKTLY